MRQNPYEKLKKIITGLGIAIIAVLIVLLVIWAGSRASDGAKKRVLQIKTVRTQKRKHQR